MDEVVEMLKAYRRELLAEQAEGLDEGWVFPTAGGGVHHTGALNKPLRSALKSAGIADRFTAHGLRRSFNNLARQVETDAILIRSITGHSTEQMREHYAHVRIEKRDLQNKVFALMVAANDNKDEPKGG